MNRHFLKKISIIFNCIKKAPYSFILIVSNFISSFLSIIGIPLLIFAYQFSQEQNKTDLPYYEKLNFFFNLINVELNFYSILIISFILIVIGQTCMGLIEIANRFVHIKVVKKNSIDLINFFKNASWTKILSDKSGKLQYAMNSESVSSAQVVLDSLRFISATIQIIFFISTSFYFSSKVTIILLIFFIILGYITVIISSKINLLANYFNNGRIKIAESISNISNNKKYLKSSIIPGFFNTVFKNIKVAWDFDWKLNLYSFYLKYIVFILTALSFAFLLLFYNEMNTKFEEVTIAILIFLRTTPAFIKLSESYSSLNEQIPAYENFKKRLHEFKISKENNGRVPYEKNSVISFKNVSYKYPRSKKLIVKKLNLKIKPNKSYAIVGKSGSGKTTIIDMFVGLLRPTNGNIYYGNTNQRKLDVFSLRKRVSYISQNISLFDGTVKENLLMGAKRTKNEIIKACKLSMAFNFIYKMPNKLNTKLGENAVKISGGQKQRILLARALLSNSEILILDEATNQLDHMTYLYIKKTIKKLKKNRTIILISHEKKVQKIVDKTFLLKN